MSAPLFHFPCLPVAVRSSLGSLNERGSRSRCRVATCLFLFALILAAPTPASATSRLANPNMLVIQPTQGNVAVGGTDPFTSSLHGAPAPGGKWTIVGGSGNGTIDGNGVFHAPAAIPFPSLIWVAYSVSGQTAMGVVNIVAAPLTVSAAQSSVQTGGAAQFSASATSGHWAVAGSTSNGAIDANGLFHAPATVPNPGTVSVTYTVGSQTASASITVTAPVPLVVKAAQTSVNTGATVQFAATQGGAPASGGQWAVLGGTANGTVDASGLFHAPATVPNPSTVAVGYTLAAQTVTASVTIVAAAPTITSVAPAVLTSLSTPVQITGTGFAAGSLILVNGTPVTTAFLDAAHLSATITLSTPSNTSLQLTVENANASLSQPVSLNASFPQITVQPAVLTPGTIHLTITGSGFAAGQVVTLNGTPLTTTVVSPSSITATGYLAPWTQGPVSVGLAASAGSSPLATRTVPLATTAVSYDAAARFTTQAAFGPRAGLIEHIQVIGFDAFITEQFQQAPIVFAPTGGKHTYISSAVQGNTLLRQRVAFALQSFIVPQWQDFDPSATIFEDKMEADATANFRQILSDVAASPNMANFLNLAGNFASNDPLNQPNQNFARELMQLFSVGPFLLNDDGSEKLDAQNQPIATYTQADVIAMSRALTGWYYPATVNPGDSAWGIDFSQPMAGWEGGHDHNAKTLFGTVVLPAGGTITSDRDAALDAIFNHPNLPPFIAHLLIQHLVTSNPSPAYIQRIAHVFENDGTEVRGNMAAIVRAILLDPEARQGDTNPSPNDGFLQEPLLFQLFAMNILQNYGSDDEINDFVGPLGEVIWTAPSVFGYVSPSYMVPGTTVNSPEFGLFTNLSLVTRTNMLWGMVSAQSGGYTTNYTQSSWLFTTFPTVPAIVSALNHMAYHGLMSAQQQQAIITAAAQISPSNLNLQLQVAVFLALNADSYNVAQ